MTGKTMTGKTLAGKTLADRAGAIEDNSRANPPACVTRFL